MPSACICSLLPAVYGRLHHKGSGSDEVVHVEITMMAILRHLFAVNGITILRVYLLSDDLLKTVEVAFSAIAVAAFVFELVAHPGGSVLGIDSHGLHGCHHPTATGHVIAWFCLLIFYGNVAAERQRNAFEQIGATDEVATNLHTVFAIVVNEIWQAVAVYIHQSRSRAIDAFAM